MSSASVTSNKREKTQPDLMQELESIKAMNSALREYLEHLRNLKKNLIAIHNNCINLNKVNSQWIDLISTL